MGFLNWIKKAGKKIGDVASKVGGAVSSGVNRFVKPALNVARKVVDNPMFQGAVSMIPKFGPMIASGAQSAVGALQTGADIVGRLGAAARDKDIKSAFSAGKDGVSSIRNEVMPSIRQTINKRPTGTNVQRR